MRIVVNGNERVVDDHLTVAGLIRDLVDGSRDGRGLAVAVEAEVVPRSKWDSRELTEGERVEVVGAIQGG